MKPVGDAVPYFRQGHKKRNFAVGEEAEGPVMEPSVAAAPECTTPVHKVNIRRPTDEEIQEVRETKQRRVQSFAPLAPNRTQARGGTRGSVFSTMSGFFLPCGSVERANEEAPDCQPARAETLLLSPD